MNNLVVFLLLSFCILLKSHPQDYSGSNGLSKNYFNKDRFCNCAYEKHPIRVRIFNGTKVRDDELNFLANIFSISVKKGVYPINY